MTSVEAQIEADQIGLWFHLAAPLDNAEVYRVLLDGLTEIWAAYRAARAEHDDARAAALLGEVVDLTALCAAARTALDCQRWRWVDRDPGCGPLPLWPLASWVW
jgi:hypothetical protein